MKKVLLGLAVIAMMAAFTSCTKTCTCTATSTNKVIDPTGWSEEDIARIEQPQTITSTGQVKGKCSKQNSNTTSTAGGVQTTVDVVCK